MLIDVEKSENIFIDETVMAEAIQLRRKANVIATKAIPYVEKMNPEYFAKVKFHSFAV